MLARRGADIGGGADDVVVDESLLPTKDLLPRLMLNSRILISGPSHGRISEQLVSSYVLLLILLCIDY